jgi:hypothetical protein
MTDSRSGTSNDYSYLLALQSTVRAVLGAAAARGAFQGNARPGSSHIA